MVSWVVNQAVRREENDLEIANKLVDVDNYSRDVEILVRQI